MKFFFSSVCLLFFLLAEHFSSGHFCYSQSFENNPNSSFLTDELPFHLNISETGGIFISGRVSTFVSEECYISKHDSAGNFLWAKMIGGTSFDYFQKTYERDNNIFCGGNTNSFGQNSQDFYFVSFDQNGDTLWTKISGGKKYDKLMDLISYGENFLLCGFSNSFGSPSNNDLLIINTDSSGEAIWAKSFEANGEEIPHSVKKSEDGGFLITGNTTSFGAGMKDAFCLKTDSLGNPLWLKSFGAGDDEDALDLIPDGGNVYIAGYTKSLSGTQDLWIFKLGPEGNLLWSKVVDFGLDEKGSRILVEAGKIFVCGYLQTMSGTQDDIFILSIDSTGNNLSAKHIPLPGAEYGNFIGESQGNFFAGGIKTDLNSMKIFEFDDTLGSCNSSAVVFDTLPMQVLVTDTFFAENMVPVDSLVRGKGGDFSDFGSEFVSAEVCPFPGDTTSIGDSGFPIPDFRFRVFPNPNSGEFCVRGSGAFALQIKLISLLGKTVYEMEVDPVTDSWNLDFDFCFPSGVYFFQVATSEFSQTRKIVIKDF